MENFDLKSIVSETISFLHKEVLTSFPGIIYIIKGSSGTFSLRGFSTESVKDSFSKLNQKDSEIFKKLNLEEDNNSHNHNEEIFYFETSSIEEAEIIVEDVFNKRYPFNDNLLCSLSDPSANWWINNDSKGFSIYFKSYSIGNSSNFYQLGPIGDMKIAFKRFSDFQDILDKKANFKSISCTPKELIISSEHEISQGLKSIFLRGVYPRESHFFSRELIGSTMYFYLNELASIRRFWINIEKVTLKN